MAPNTDREAAALLAVAPVLLAAARDSGPGQASAGPASILSDGPHLKEPCCSLQADGQAQILLQRQAAMRVEKNTLVP